MVASIALAAAGGAATGFAPLATLAAAGSVAVAYLAFVLPARVVLFGFMFVTLSGLRPFPPVLGFHIQAQYFMLAPLLVRSVMSGRGTVRIASAWRGRLVVAAALLPLAALVALGHALASHARPAGTLIGDYVAWVMVFLFLAVLLQLTREKTRDFTGALYRDLVDVLGLFSAFTLISAFLQFRSLAEATSHRLQLVDLGPNETGLIVAAGVVLTLAPSVVRGLRLRELIWLPFSLSFLVLTGSRESLAALLFGLALLLFSVRNLRYATVYLYVLVASAAVLLSILAADESLLPTNLNRADLMPQIAPYRSILGVPLDRPMAERVYLQVSGVSVFLQNPLLGLGFDVPLHIPEGMNTPDTWRPPVMQPVAHDSYITVAAQQGLLGLIPFCFLVFAALRVTRVAVLNTVAASEDHALAVGLRCAVATLVFGSLNIDALYTEFKPMSIFLWLVVTALLLHSPGRAAAPERAKARATGPAPAHA